MGKIVVELDELDVDLQSSSNLDVQVGNDPNQNKTLVIKKNGIQNCSKYDLVNVLVTPIIQKKELTYTENGTYEIIPDEGSYFSKVTVTFNKEIFIPIEKISLGHRHDVFTLNNTNGDYYQVYCKGKMNTAGQSALYYTDGADYFGVTASTDKEHLAIVYNTGYQKPFSYDIVAEVYEDSNGKCKINDWEYSFDKSTMNKTVCIGGSTYASTSDYYYFKVVKNGETILDLKPYKIAGTDIEVLYDKERGVLYQ